MEFFVVTLYLKGWCCNALGSNCINWWDYSWSINQPSRPPDGATMVTLSDAREDVTRYSRWTNLVSPYCLASYWVQKLSRRSRHCIAKRKQMAREHFHQLLAILTPICWASWSGAAASDQNFPEGQAIAQQLCWTGGALEDLVAQMTGSTCCTWREVTLMLPLSDNQRPIRLDKIHNLKLTAR